MHRQLSNIVRASLRSCYCHQFLMEAPQLPAADTSSRSRKLSTTPPQKEGWLSSKMMETRQRFGMAEKPKSYYRLKGLELFRGVESVDWKEYFRVFNMPDTFHSWFLVIELHMWMLNVRINNEGGAGDHLKRFSLESMWDASKIRAKNLESYSSSSLRESFDDLYEELMAAFLMYDLGLLGSDVDLANALWYRFLQEKCDDPEKLELLVRHIRKQIDLLEKLSKEEFIDKTGVTWLPLSSK
ncbi:ubiquinol-cytochrome-c reductase complex assembly factor 1 isoform X2 [Thrips palmi]|uniref:Ubiquinol-cytochrome-c reductase complex assembly factor 1 isoform X2 n=1 Tax=Thrips palmi TaxID=161013 RepID=A0A6P9AHI0_THRPL|nr:ubiquinol-cytochrome-c reductase complex assembly factor 1 isoform X2 [Thrips palmi]